MMTLEQLKDSVNTYRKDLDEFKRTHKRVRCCCCLQDIEPGADIVPDWDNERVYCSFDCYCSCHDIDKIIYNDGDEEYSCWFEKIEEEE